MKCTLKNTPVTTLVDSGAEVNVMEASVLHAANIGITKTKHLAKAANQLPLEICGQSESPITLMCSTDKGVKSIYLGLVLVVNNLGIDCLIGEPGKAANNIICLPRKKIIILAADDDVHQVPYLSHTPQHVLVRASNSINLEAGEQISYKLPEKRVYHY